MAKLPQLGAGAPYRHPDPTSFSASLEVLLTQGLEQLKKERQQRDAALIEYVEKHPELWFSSKKPSWEELHKVTKGFEEYYQKKKLKTKTRAP